MGRHILSKLWDNILMIRQIKGLILIILGVAVFFPIVALNKFIFKFILALALVWAGYELIFGKKNR